MSTFDKSWAKLTTAARLAPDARDMSAPYGLATHVAAQAMAVERPSVRTVFERFSWRALGVGCVLAAASFAVNYSAVVNTVEDELTTSDTVAEVLSIS